VKTASGATAVQVVWSKRGGKRDLEHVGSAHDGRELAVLRGAAEQIIRRGQGELDLGLGAERRLVVAGSRSARLWRALEAAYRAVGFDRAVPDHVFESLVLARVVEPTSKLDSLRLLEELGVAAPSYRTVKRRLRQCVEDGWRGRLEDACASHVQVFELRFCLYDVTTLYWETHEGDGFREPGFSKERRLEPQVVVGLLTTAGGFPLSVRAFEGNEAETKTMVAVVAAYADAHQVEGVTVVADAGMVSEKNMRGLQDAGLGFIVGQRIPSEPFLVADWRRKHPGGQIPDGKVFAQRADVGTKKKPRPCVVYYQWRAKRARRDLGGIDKTLAKARRQGAGDEPVKKNRFLTVAGGEVSVNEELVADARARAGLRAYITDLPYRPEAGDGPFPLADPKGEAKRLLSHAAHVIDAYHELWHVEHAFRISKSDLAARPAYHHLKDSINAHLTIVFAALTVGSWIESATGLSLRRFVKTLRLIREVDIAVGRHTVTAEDALPDAARSAINAINTAVRRGH
jgi:hypothetical protein